MPDIGYHHRGAEKMGERQSLAHLHPLYRPGRLPERRGERARLPDVGGAAGRHRGAADRAKMIRVMMTELYRIGSHLVYYGTYAQDVGQMSPVLYMFVDRERMYSDRRSRSAAPACTPSGSASAESPRTCPPGGTD